MDSQYRQDSIGSVGSEQYRHEDEAMGGMEDSTNTSTTPTTIGYGNGHSSRHQAADSPQTDSEHGRYPSPGMAHQQHISRPSSGLSGSGDRYGQTNTYQEQNQRGYGGPESAKARDSVVIKVGMVGDAQIGKTSLMVKYVEGSWDEDYIQTLGKATKQLEMCC